MTWIGKGGDKNENKKIYLSDRFAVNAELSNKPLLPGFDYNVVSGGWKTLASLYYGKTAGYP